MVSIRAIATEINAQAEQYEFGKFQSLRKQLKGMKNTRSVIFDTAKASVNEEEGWAFHTGGREELQFNIGVEEKRFRFGVAFSLEPSRSLLDIAPLIPKIERFNEFVRVNAQTLDPFRMWIWRGSEIIKPDTAVRQITSDEMEMPTFIFLGKAVPIPSIDVPEILRTFGELLPLYCFVEGADLVGDLPVGESRLDHFPELSVGNLPFSFRERVTLGDIDTSRKSSPESINVLLRSNQIKRQLCQRLRRVLSIKIGDEIPSGNGGRIDLVVLHPSGEYDFYEIKPAVFARHAIREALPQLLEYSYRRGGVTAQRLIIASQAPLDDDSRAFLGALRTMGLPIYYEQVVLD